MTWINVKESTPITYKTGDFDGMNSDIVLIVDNNYNVSIGFLNEGFINGFKYKDWYDEKEYLLNEIPLYWMPLPSFPN